MAMLRLSKARHIPECDTRTSVKVVCVLAGGEKVGVWFPRSQVSIDGDGIKATSWILQKRTEQFGFEFATEV